MLSDAPGVSALPPTSPVCMIEHHNESADITSSAGFQSTFDGHNIHRPTLLRPELTGPFDALAHKVEDFKFTPTTSGFCQPWTQRPRARSKRQPRKRQGNKAEKAPVRCFVDTTHMSPMTAFKVAARLVAARRSPRKRAMLEPPAAADDDAPVEFEDIYDDLSMDLWDAKASIRKHLLDISPVHTAATKRRVNGLERNWIRAHQMDPDVKYLLQFPGDIAADKARELVAMRDLIPLDYVEEADGSLVMSMETAPQASLTSAASRLGKLDMAESKMIEKEASLSSDDVHAQKDVDRTGNDAEYSEEPGEASDLSIVVTPTSIQVCSVPKCPGSSPVKSPVKRRCPGMSPRTPRTPKASAQHEILDVDLHEQPDIFASAVSKRHKEATPAVTVQPSWLTATPRPFSPADASLHVDENADAQWSPMVFTPGQATDLSPTLSHSQAHSTPDSPSKQPPASEAETRHPLESSSPDAGEQTHSTPSTPQPSAASEQPRDSQAEIPAITITAQATPEIVAISEAEAEAEAPQQAPMQDDDRTFLLQFMNKHHAVKSRTAMTSPITQAALATRHEAATTAPGTPRTPDAAPIRMWVDAPSEVASDRRSRQHETPVKSSASKKRAALAPLDSNSPSPVKARVGKRKLEEEPEEGKPDRNKEDGGEQAPEPSPKRRRGLRARKPAVPSAPLAGNARAVRSGEKDLASLTRANTRANKGSASMPEEVLERFAADPMGQKWKERKEVVDAKAARAASASIHGKARSKNVRWAETLAQFREGSPMPEEEEDLGEMVEEEETAAVVAPSEDDFIPKKPARASRAKQAVPVAAPAIPKTPPKSKLPAPTRRAAPATPAAVSKKPVRSAQHTKTQQKEGGEMVKPRPTRAAAQKSNLSMGLTATGTPIRKGRGRPRSVK